MRIRSAWVAGACVLGIACGGGGETTTTTTRRTTQETTGVEPRARTTAETGMAEQRAAMAPGDQPRTGVQPMAGQERTTCPADLDALQVQVGSIPRGATMELTAADRDALRGRMRLFAKIHEMHRLEQTGREHPIQKPREGAVSAQPALPPGEIQPKLAENPPEQRFADADAMIHQASAIQVVETPDGARLEIRFDDATRVSALRQELDEDAQQLRAGNCPLALSIQRG